MNDTDKYFSDTSISYDEKMFTADGLSCGMTLDDAIKKAKDKVAHDWASNNAMGVYGNVWFRNLDMVMGERIKQHSHEHPHITLIGHGAVIAHIEGHEPRAYKAGEAVPVPANLMHSFQATEPNTVAFCTYAVRNDENGEVQNWDDCLKLFAPRGEESPDLHPNKLKPEVK